MPILINENISPSEKVDLIELVRKYIDVFGWTDEDMPELDPQVTVHQLNINPIAKQSNIIMGGSDQKSWGLLKLKLKGSYNQNSLEKNIIQTG